MKNIKIKYHSDFNTNRDAIATDGDNISQTAECAENPDFTNGENRRTICGTTTNNGYRTRQNCGFFVSQIYPNHGLTTPVIHSEFAVRLISRNKAETIRTNKASRLLAVVETVSPLSSDISVQPFTKLTTMNKPTQTPSDNNTTRGVSTAITHRQAEKFFTAGLAQDSDTIATNLCTFSKNRERCRFSAETDRLHFADNGGILPSVVAKSTAERGNSFNLVKANSTPNRAFFVRNFRTPKENNKLKIEPVAFLSMVERNGKGSPFAVCLTRRFSTPLRSTAQTVESLSGRLSKNLLVKDTAMLFKFLTGSRLKITIRANSEQEARQRLQLSESAICIARYSNAFLAQKQAKLTACKGVSYA